MRPRELDDTDADTIRGDSSEEDSAYCDNNKRKRDDVWSDGLRSSSSELSDPPSSSDTDCELRRPIITKATPPTAPVKRGRGRPKKMHTDQSSKKNIQKVARKRGPKSKLEISTAPKVGRNRRKSLDPYDVLATDRAGQTNLHIACQQNNLERVKYLVERGADLNAEDNGNWTPLHEAAYAGHTEIVRYLLENGAHVNIVDREGDTPLHDACYQVHTHVVKLLLEYGADVEERNDKNKKPDELTSDEEILELLRSPVECLKRPVVTQPVTPTLSVAFDSLKTVSEPNSPTSKKPTRSRNPRDEGVRRRSSARNQRATVPNDALRLEPKFRDKETGRTHLHNHAKRGRVQEVHLLLETFASPNAVDFDGRTPVHDAAYEGQCDVLQVLLAFQGDPNLKDNDNKNTPLHDAARKGHASIVELLLQAGAKPDLKNVKGKTPLDLAKSEEVRNILKRIYTEKGMPFNEDTESVTHSSPMYTTDEQESPISIISPVENPIVNGDSMEENIESSQQDSNCHVKNAKSKSKTNDHLKDDQCSSTVNCDKISIVHDDCDKVKLTNNDYIDEKLNFPTRMQVKHDHTKVSEDSRNNRKVSDSRYDCRMEVDSDEDSVHTTPTRTAATRTTAVRRLSPAIRNTSITRPTLPSPTDTSYTSSRTGTNGRDSSPLRIRPPTFKLPAKFETKIGNACLIQRDD